MAVLFLFVALCSPIYAQDTDNLALIAQSPSQKTAQKKTVTFCADPDWLPYEAIRNGQHVGIAADYLNLIGDLASIHFSLVETQSWEQALAFVQSGQCDLLGFLNQTASRERYLDFSDDFFSSANVFVTDKRIAFLAGYESIHPDMVIGVVKDYRHAEYVQLYYPELTIREVESETEGLLKVSAGDIDIFLGSMLSVSAQIQNFGLSELKISGLAKPHDKMRIGVRKNNSDLLKLLNLAIAQIPEAEHVKIFRQWNNVKVIDEIDYRFLWLMFGVVFLLTSLILLRNRYVSRFNKALMVKTQMLEELQEELLEKNKSLEFLSNHDQLTSLYNRRYMIKRCESEMQRMKRFAHQSSLILFDIDYFKNVNDLHGHSSGDSVLRELADLVSQQVREIDVTSRWGGEEFLILCPQSSAEETLALANRLHQAIKDYSFSRAQNISCSFGVANYRNNEDFVSWFDRADNALYLAKTGGRSQIVVASAADTG